MAVDNSQIEKHFIRHFSLKRKIRLEAETKVREQFPTECKFLKKVSRKYDHLLDKDKRANTDFLASATYRIHVDSCAHAQSTPFYFQTCLPSLWIENKRRSTLLLDRNAVLLVRLRITTYVPT